MFIRTDKENRRTLDQLREHYEIERQLALKLRNASKEERSYLYSDLYNELFRRVQHHPQITRKISTKNSRKYLKSQMRFLRPFLKDNSLFLEVGPGDCSLSIEVSKLFVKFMPSMSPMKSLTNHYSQQTFNLSFLTGAQFLFH